MDGTTTCRTGLEATAQIYLKDVSVDEHGFLSDYAIAYLPPWADRDEIKRALADAINTDMPERIHVYDEDDRSLADHPGTPTTAISPPASASRFRDRALLAVRVLLARNGERVARMGAGGLCPKVIYACTPPPGEAYLAEITEIAPQRYQATLNRQTVGTEFASIDDATAAIERSMLERYQPIAAAPEQQAASK
jgi:hypothetical protein